jgi:prefoldin subunit 5
MESLIYLKAEYGFLNRRSRELELVRSTLSTRKVGREAATSGGFISARVGADIAERGMVCISQGYYCEAKRMCEKSVEALKESFWRR